MLKIKNVSDILLGLIFSCLSGYITCAFGSALFEVPFAGFVFFFSCFLFFITVFIKLVDILDRSFIPVEGDEESEK